MLPSHPMVISFSGIDGAGKSTQIDNLITHLTAAGLSITLITFWDNVVMLKALREGAGHKVFKGDKGVGSPDAPIQRRDKNVRSPIITVFRMAFYLLDAFALRKIMRRVKQSNVDVVIFDRYLLDEVANLNFDNAFVRAYAHLLLKLMPKPSISFVLDADPIQAFARKPEYPLDFLHINRNAYLRLAREVGATIIPPSTIEAAKAAVVESVAQRQRSLQLHP